MDKTKIFEAAGKFAAKGQNDKAAKEYQRILEEDPKDVRALQKLAEIHQKSGKMKEATDLLMRVADGYTEQGFFLKAVAVYKQLLKSGVERIEVNQKLAGLYQQLGLIGDATQQFQLVANYFDQQGNIKESLAALRKMVELDPDNVASQVKLGELYAREQLIPEAVAELRKAGAYLKRNNRNEDYFRVLERIGQLAPDDIEAARELAQNYIAVADTKRALAKLQICFRNNPKDVETLRLLARAFVDLGQEAKAVSVYRELAKVHLERKESVEYRQTLERILEHSPDDPQAVAALKELAADAAPAVIAPAAPAAAKSAATAPSAPPGSRPPRRARPLSPDISPVVAKILTETDVYLKYGLVAKAAEHIKKALIEDMDSLDAQEKLLAILDRQNKPEESLRTIERIIELARSRNDQDRVGEYMQELASRAPDHPLVTSAAPPAPISIEDDDEGVAIVQPDEEFEDGILINTDPTIPPHLRPHVPPPEVSIAPWERVSAEEQAVVVESSAGPAQQRLDLGDDASFAAELDRVTGPHARRPQIDPFAVVSEPDDAAIVTDDRIPNFPAPIPTAAARAHYVAPMHLDADASLAALEELPIEPASVPPISMAPIALTAFDELAAVPYADSVPPEQAPDPERSIQPWDAPDALAADAEPAADQDVYDAAPAEEAPPEAEAVAAADYADEYAEEYDEAEFLVQQGHLSDAQDVLEGILLAAPEHPRALALLQSLTPQEGEQPAEASSEEAYAAPQPEGYVDLAGALAMEMGESSPPVAASEGSHSAEGALAEFKKQLSVQVSAEDSQTHFDLGIAYKEMGLIDDAISEFEIALDGRGRRRVVDCLTMLGVLRLEKGDPRAALVHFEQVLKTPGLTLEASKEAHFEIGHCHELLEEDREAYDHYSRVYKADQGFRDVKVRMGRLKDKLGKTSPPPLNGVVARNGVHGKGANGVSSTEGETEAAVPAPAENSGPRGGRGKIGYI